MIVFNKDVNLSELDENTARKVLSCVGSLMMVEVHFKKGGAGEVHSHDTHEQVSYIIKGSFEVIVGEEKRVLKSGDSFYAGKNVKHGIVALEDSIILDVFTPIRQEFIC